MQILVDLDDVLGDLLEVWILALNAKHNLHVKYNDVVEWDMTKTFPTLTTKDIYEPFSNEDFWKLLCPKEDSQKYIRILQYNGHEIYVVTSTHYDFIAMKMKYIIKKYFPFIPYDHVIIAHKKQMIKGDVLIDDYIPNLIGGEYKKILFDAPYNRDISDEMLDVYGITRVRSWDEAYREINRLDRG